MLNSITTVLAFASAAAAVKTSRTFAVNHFYGKGPLTIGRMDPIINPGAPSGHVHAIQGGSNFALTMSDTTLLDSTCTSSLVKNDKSNYWTPTVYFTHTNGSLEAVNMYYMNVYYFFEATDDDIVAFKPGHRMVSGNPTLRTPPASGGKSVLLSGTSDGAPQPVQFTCPRQNYDEASYPVGSDGLTAGIVDPNNKGAGVGFPDVTCDGTYSPLRADIHFPSCYNPAAGLDNYKENMVWPTAAANSRQNCPEGYVHVPHIFYEVYWDTQPFKGMWTEGQGKQPFVLSNGDMTGYGLHADFIAGWDVETLQQVIDNCDAGDSGMDKCPGLIGGLNDASTSCNIPNLVPETVMGVMGALPGKNLLSSYGAAAPVAPAGSSSVAAVPVPASTPASTEAGTAPTTSPESTPVAVLPTIATHVQVSSAVISVAPVETVTAGESIVTVYTTITKTVDYSSPTDVPAAPSNPGSSAVTIPGWSTLGCYSDSMDRVLTGVEFADIGNKNVTSTKCTTYCEAKGFSIAGTEYGGQCFCGNELQGSTKLDESKCDIPCEGNGVEQCGGSWALTVYKKSAASKRSTKHAARHARHGQFHKN